MNLKRRLARRIVSVIKKAGVSDRDAGQVVLDVACVYGELGLKHTGGVPIVHKGNGVVIRITKQRKWWWQR